MRSRVRAALAATMATVCVTGWTPPAAAAFSWCGEEAAADHKQRELANGAYRFHAVYLYAADGADRFDESAGQIQADAFGASALVERLYDRAFRFDMGTACGGAWLDVSKVRAYARTADFERAAVSPEGTLRLVARELGRAGFAVLGARDSRAAARRLKRNWLVWVDAPSPVGACGAADEVADTTRSQSNWNNYGGKIALVFRYRDRFCGRHVVRHEIAHVLGARHCSDAYEDTMCDDGPRRGGGAYGDEFFDFGNDDYWDPPAGAPLPHWTVNLSRFVCPTADCNRTSRRSS